MKMNPVVHFEMPYKNPKRVSKFYSNVFGWEMRYLPKMGKYVLATTSPVDKNQMHKKNDTFHVQVGSKDLGYDNDASLADHSGNLVDCKWNHLDDWPDISVRIRN